MSETPEQETARIMFTTLNAVYSLHAAAEAKDCEKCVHCSIIAGRIVDYPCPTVNLLLRDMVAENGENPAA